MNTRLDPYILMAPPAAPFVLKNPRRKRGQALIGNILMEIGELSAGDMVRAIAMRAREDAQFGEILLANQMVSESGLYRGLAIQFNCEVADLVTEPPDYRLITSLGAENCLRLGVVPWKRIGAATLVATSRPEQFKDALEQFPADFGTVLMVIAPEADIQRALLRTSHLALARRAETRVKTTESCRDWNTGAMARLLAALLIALASGILAAPRATILLLTSWAIIALVFNTGLKATAAWAVLKTDNPKAAIFRTRRSGKSAMKLPRISIMVPLFKEREIASRLVRRLQRINYPRALLDICLVVEEDDTITQGALERANLPFWMRQIVVPRAKLKTKPRALNYALDFCKGSIIGVYDAEDAPEPDQLFKVARRFHECGPQVACLQGILDFYNAGTNWLSRCFAVEYATWFRIVLPGLERLGLVIPLGGTTIFFRRDALEKIGGWDAHNVTEDADLGVRLARRGYTTQLLPTVTEEEANCRVWPWIKQRSRWLKGYAITWAVHMRNPRKLLSELGPWRFFGVQVLFLGALSQFLLAPILWSFWVIPFGIPHPIQSAVSPTAFYLLTGTFLVSELVTLVVGIVALKTSNHRGLWKWVPTLHFYFPLASIAAYKGVWELISKPFYWDKTTHGHSDNQDRNSVLVRQIYKRVSRARPLRQS